MSTLHTPTATAAPRHPAPAPPAPPHHHPEAPMTRVLLADDHQLLREGLRRYLEEAGLDVVGEAADGEEAVRLAERTRPDVVLMDVTMPVLDGIEATRQLLTVLPGTPVVMLTMHADADTAQRALDAGAAGYLLKDCSTDEVATAVARAAQGDRSIAPDVAAALDRHALHQADVDEVLTKREREVLQLIADGLSTKDAARVLYISIKTVKNHLASIYAKLDARDRTQAVVSAARLGIVRLP
jgi:two-component system, NarL family, response regulator DegU